MKNFYFILIFASLILCSCEKSEKEKYSTEANNAANDAAEAGRIYITNLMATNAAFFSTNGWASNFLEEVPAMAKMAITNEVFIEVGILGNKIKQMHDDNLLPGVSKDEHGDMTSDTVDTVVSNTATILTYPASQTFHLVKEGEIKTNNYTFLKQSSDAEWQLTKAWETDSNGFIQEWPVK